MSRYEIRIEGTLSDTATMAFGAHQLRALPPETALIGPVRDDAQLRGILDLVADLGLHLVELHELPD